MQIDCVCCLSVGEKTATAVLSLLHDCYCQHVIKAWLLFVEIFFCSLPLRLVSQKKLLVNHPFSDCHLAVENSFEVGRL